MTHAESISRQSKSHPALCQVPISRFSGLRCWWFPMMGEADRIRLPAATLPPQSLRYWSIRKGGSQHLVSMYLWHSFEDVCHPGLLALAASNSSCRTFNHGIFTLCVLMKSASVS